MIEDYKLWAMFWFILLITIIFTWRIKLLEKRLKRFEEANKR